MRILVIGDVGGHADRLASILAREGADLDTGRLPDGTAVVQVGDLVDRGPASAECVAIADRFLRGEGTWIQLLGNHEGNRLGAPVFWDEPLDEAAVTTLQAWWSKKQARMAVALRTDSHGELLVSHSGMSRRLWTMLGQPDCAAAARAVNRWVGEEIELAFSSGQLLAGGLPGVAWADAANELYLPWDSASVVPFGQIHGHSPVLDWPRGRARRQVPRAIRGRITADPERQHSRIDIRGRPFICVDPGLGRDGAGRKLAPLVLEGDILA